MHLRGTITARRIAVAAATAGVLLALPGVAEGKTFVAKFTDPTGDSTSDARDIVAGRVAYNRKTGALSATMQVAGNFADERKDAVAVVIVSDLTNGKCHKIDMTMGALISDPAVPVAWRGSSRSAKNYYGTGNIDGDTYTLRVKAKGLAGRTPGCTALGLTSPDDQGTVYDDTPITNGFR